MKRRPRRPRRRPPGAPQIATCRRGGSGAAAEFIRTFVHCGEAFPPTLSGCSSSQAALQDGNVAAFCCCSKCRFLKRPTRSARCSGRFCSLSSAPPSQRRPQHSGKNGFLESRIDARKHLFLVESRPHSEHSTGLIAAPTLSLWTRSHIYLYIYKGRSS